MNDFASVVLAVQRVEAVPKILEVVCRTTGMGFAAVARVTDSRWICCAVRDGISFGLQPGAELMVETTLCHEIRQSNAEIVIDNVIDDPLYCGHHTPAMYGFKSYISVPIVLSDGRFFGTLCALDTKPARLNTFETISMFKLFAELIAFHLEASDKLALSEADLSAARETAELREQFIAILGHDLRNPLASIAAGAHLLRNVEMKDKERGILDLMQVSTRRMAALIENMMDFARGRLGGGLFLNCSAQDIEPVLRQVVAELQSSTPGTPIDTSFDLSEPVYCDAARIGQMFSNLLGNAMTYGAAGAPVRVSARTEPHHFELSVANRGDPIPQASMQRLFLPFSRGAARQGQEGLGLGLYIASEIAKAHGGTLGVSSTPSETCFTFRMPMQARVRA